MAEGEKGGRIRIIVATHRLYTMPAEAMYLPVQAGAACHGKLPYTGDDTGEHISERNGQYCELTALYWGWKNLPAEALGLCHYRRYFREPGSRRPLTEATLRKMMAEVPVILPKKRHYRIETGESQFVHAHGEESLAALRAVLREREPEYLPGFDRSMRKTSGHRFNMMIMRRAEMDEYCSWLFPVLFETERRLGTPEPRMMGYLAERLTDAWIGTTGKAYRELRVLSTERTNWMKKGGAFLMRKIRGGRTAAQHGDERKRR